MMKKKKEKRSSDVQSVTNMPLVDQGIQTDPQNNYPAFFPQNIPPFPVYYTQARHLILQYYRIFRLQSGRQ